MLALVKRNCLLYFRNRSGVVFSLLGALISFILYLVFLKDNIESSWSQIDLTFHNGQKTKKVMSVKIF